MDFFKKIFHRPEPPPSVPVNIQITAALKAAVRNAQVAGQKEVCTDGHIFFFEGMKGIIQTFYPEHIVQKVKRGGTLLPNFEGETCMGGKIIPNVSAKDTIDDMVDFPEKYFSDVKGGIQKISTEALFAMI